MKHQYKIILSIILCYLVSCNFTSSEIEITSEENTSLLCVRKNGKFGYINDKGEEIIPCMFDRTSFFSEGLVGLQKGNKWAYYNAKGQKVLDLKRRFTFCGEFHNGVAMVSTEPTKDILPNHISYYEDLCQKELIFINKKGEVIFKIKNEWGVDCYEPTMMGFSDGLLRLKKELPEGKTMIGFLDKKGHLKIPFKFFERGSLIKNFSDGLAISIEQKYIPNVEGPIRKYGYINKKGEWVIPPIYDNAYPFSHGAAVVAELIPNEKYKIKYFLIDKSGNRIFSSNVSTSHLLVRDSLLAVYKTRRRENRKENFGIYNTHRYALAKTDGTMVTDFIFGKLQPGETSNDLWTAVLPGTKEFGFIDDKGSVVIPYQFSSVREKFETGLAVVREKDKKDMAVINTNGEYVLHQEKNVDYHIMNNGGVIYVTDETGENYYYNKDGQIINLEGYDIFGLFRYLKIPKE